MNQNSAIVAVTGGRTFSDYGAVCIALGLVHHAYGIRTIIHGGATGADRLAVRWANENGVATRVYPAKWSKYGKSAGPIRNQEMVDRKPAVLVVFDGGKGTHDMETKARQADIPVVRVLSPVTK